MSVLIDSWHCQLQYPHLNRPQCSNLQVDPGAKCELYGSKKMCWMMHARNKGTHAEAFIIRQTVDAIMIAHNLLPPTNTQRETA